MPEIQVFVRDGLVIIAIANNGCLAMPVKHLTPNEAEAFADAFAVTVKEMAASARRSGAIVEQLKTGAK